MSSPNHPTFDIEDAFSFNFPDYFPATSGNASPDSSNDLTKYLLATLVFSPLHDDPYIEVMQAYYVTNELPIPPLQAFIASPTVMPPYVLSYIDRMPPKRKSTSTAPAMTQAAIRQLIANGIVAALEAQAATMANTDNPNRNNRPRKTLVAKRTKSLKAVNLST
nr:hypothetical protein [Tanacetum cinerariifolium]